jgi:fumarate reductase subunit D
METMIGAGFTTVTNAVADRVGSVTLAACTVTTFGTGGTAGALYNPVLSIVPSVVFPPATPSTDHVAPWFELPVTLSVNCCVCPTITVCAGGFTTTTTSTASVSALEVPPPGAGVVTATARLPAFANCAAGTSALNCVALPYVVASAVLPNSTTDCALKPVPVTVSVVFPLPALMVAGKMVLATGAGFTMVTVAAAERVGSVTLAAVKVTVFGAGGTAGAVYNPVLSTVPTVTYPPATPSTDQVAP